MPWLGPAGKFQALRSCTTSGFACTFSQRHDAVASSLTTASCYAYAETPVWALRLYHVPIGRCGLAEGIHGQAEADVVGRLVLV